MNKKDKLGIIILIIGVIIWLSILINSIYTDSKKDYDTRIKNLEFKVLVLENSINKKDTTVINLNLKNK